MYMAQKNEERISTKIWLFEKPIDMQKCNLAVKDNVKKSRKMKVMILTRISLM